MIKKIYTSPRSEVVTFHTESLMTTTSMIKSDSIELGGSEALGNERGWSSESWNNADKD